MKKLILCITLLAGMTFIACSEEEDVPHVNYVICQVCEIADQEGMPDQDYDVCVDADGFAYVYDANTNVAVERYFNLFCENAYAGPEPIDPGENPTEEEPGGENPGTGEVTNCVTCAEYQVMGQTMPAMDVCEAPNGNAVVDGVETTMTYQQAITTYSNVTTCQ